jgi:hypothetical protein
MQAFFIKGILVCPFLNNQNVINCNIVYYRSQKTKQMKKYRAFIFPFFALSLLACNKELISSDTSLIFDSIPVVKPVVPIINEASGIADSKINPNYLWVEEDSGNPPQLYLLGHNGNVLKTIYIKGAVNRDWEDMALINDTIYVADIGDNSLSFSDYTIYQFAEPSASTDTVTSFNTIHFAYPDGPHDAEAFLIEPATKDIYIITKRDASSKIYKLGFPYSTASVDTVSLAGTLNYNDVVSAAMDPGGREIIIKTYLALYYYTRSAGETIEQALNKNYTTLPYLTEPKGEAVTFANDNSGFFTLSEIGLATTVNLYFYSRE